MSIQNLLNQFLGTTNAGSAMAHSTQGIGETLSKLSSNIPDGLISGAAAGGIMALLVNSKSARKFAGSAASYGGVALLGGLAYKAYKNWQYNSTGQTVANTDKQNQLLPEQNVMVTSSKLTPDFQLTLIKAMIAAAKADGHIDATEQQRIFDSVEQMNLSAEMKGLVFDLLRQPISVAELANDATSMERKSEIYLASCLVINPDHPSEQAHLDNLALALKLPEGLAQQLQWQAQQALVEAA